MQSIRQHKYQMPFNDPAAVNEITDSNMVHSPSHPHLAANPLHVNTTVDNENMAVEQQHDNRENTLNNDNNIDTDLKNDDSNYNRNSHSIISNDNVIIDNHNKNQNDIINNHINNNNDESILSKNTIENDNDITNNNENINVNDNDHDNDNDQIDDAIKNIQDKATEKLKSLSSISNRTINDGPTEQQLLQLQQLQQIQQIQQLQQLQLQQAQQIRSNQIPAQQMLFYSHLFSQQNQNQNQSQNQKDNPLLTLANSVPTDNNPHTKDKQEHIQSDSFSKQSNNSTSNFSSTDWLNPMGLPVNMANNIAAALINQQEQSSNENINPNNNKNELSTTSALSQMLRYNNNNNNSNNTANTTNNNLANTMNTLNSLNNFANLNNFNIDLSKSKDLIQGQQSDIILDPSNDDTTSTLLVPPPLSTLPSTSKVFICQYPGCNKTFSRKLNYVSHYQSKHEHKKPFECEICHKLFARHSDRRRHEKSQHTVKQTYICGGILENGIKWGCGKKFKRKDGLTAHWKSLKAKKKCFENLKNENISISIIDKNLNEQ